MITEDFFEDTIHEEQKKGFWVSPFFKQAMSFKASRKKLCQTAFLRKIQEQFPHAVFCEKTAFP
ncbi:hypothetical protein [Komagataeibacter oboediens]|uniref:Uncharacterized protein n=1 Tax=Komagataeibacter oboediens TaxID=65958 RepID=A0A318R835_9PROT|nr:hypothetical protein [Komagataeibacter oboediens]MBV1823995.1 hypothetical protein [Komagataeibacter oboediens]PYD82473.1 hypothetical protein CFR80_06115 [Komagataeibacter oboediens]